MTKRLQVLLDDAELAEIRCIAKRHHMTVSASVPEALHEARREEPASDACRKLAIVREASTHAFPSGDIDQMLQEIERGAL